MKLMEKMNALAVDLPRGEYPRPEMVREDWLCLNGAWDFRIDTTATGLARNWQNDCPYDSTITVPFCPESRLSGIANRDFMAAVWYRRSFVLPKAWAGKRILAHFDAVDYEAHVFVNGREAGTHRGGFVGFTLDITALVQPGENTLVVCALDDIRSGKQPGGKQSNRYESYGCSYTRTTGIWQTVWLEAVADRYVQEIRYTPDLAGGKLHIRALVNRPGARKLRVCASYEGEDCGCCEIAVNGLIAQGELTLSAIHPWEAGKGGLYDLCVKLDGDDAFASYFGLRSVGWGDKVMTLNGKPVFQRLILDQGFYPTGIWTAPSDEELKADILRSMAMGFNGARLHQKVFEPRFLFWADQLGYLVWDELGNWGIDYSADDAALSFLPEWVEEMRRDMNHPAIVGWCPYNETWNRQDNGHGRRNLALTWQVTKAIDPTRPCIDTSGGFHCGVTDIHDVHDYTQDPAVMHAHYDDTRRAHEPFPDHEAAYDGEQPYFVSEYGGIRWPQDGQEGWGYGDAPKTPAEFIERYRGLTHALLDNPGICAFCYTQLTDIEQEVNGLYYYDRRPKLDPAIIREINQHKAAIEE